MVTWRWVRNRPAQKLCEAVVPAVLTANPPIKKKVFRVGGGIDRTLLTKPIVGASHSTGEIVFYLRFSMIGKIISTVK